MARKNHCVDSKESHGILVTAQAQPTLEDNICERNKECGIAYSDSAGGVARKNRCVDNKKLHGIYVGGQARPTLEENVCERNKDSGILYFDSAGGVARKNRCMGNQGYGIFVGEQAQPTLEANTCMENKNGDLFNSTTANNTIDSMSAYLEINRISNGVVDDFFKYKVYVDGTLVGKIKSGATETFRVYPGIHRVHLNSWFGNINSNFVTISVSSDQCIKLKCGLSTDGTPTLWQ